MWISCLQLRAMSRYNVLKQLKEFNMFIICNGTFYLKLNNDIFCHWPSSLKQHEWALPQSSRVREWRSVWELTCCVVLRDRKDQRHNMYKSGPGRWALLPSIGQYNHLDRFSPLFAGGNWFIFSWVLYALFVWKGKWMIKCDYDLCFNESIKTYTLSDISV